MSYQFPDELVEEIMSKLATKPLIRFKSVSKTWCSFISTPRFLANHLLPAALDDGKVLLVKRNHHTNTRDIIFSLLPHHNLTPTRLLPYPQEPISPQIQTWLLPLPDHRQIWDSRVSIMGPRNGLVCLFDDTFRRHISVWNLLDGEVKALPDSDVPDPPGHRSYMPLLGFGYDVDTQCFKVIRISALNPHDEYAQEEDHGYHKVEIYSSNADTWKGYNDFERRFGSEVGFTHPMEAYVNGVMLWLVCTFHYDSELEQECNDYFILWFRFSDEVLGETTLPSKAEIESVNNAPFGERGYGLSWGKLFFVMKDETLAFVTYDTMLQGEQVCFHVWALLEFGVESSWTRMFTVGPLTGIDRPLRFCKAGSMIMETMKGELVLYHPFTKEMTPLNICGDRETIQIIPIEERFIL